LNWHNVYKVLLPQILRSLQVLYRRTHLERRDKAIYTDSCASVYSSVAGSFVITSFSLALILSTDERNSIIHDVSIIALDADVKHKRTSTKCIFLLKNNKELLLNL
jgi:hypothetical protein